VPEGWVREATSGPWPFVTAERFRRPDGSIAVWSSRADRKRSAEPTGSTWWAPSARGWWIGVLFAIGSTCFALGSFPPYAVAVGAGADSTTYFIGSIFFTSAAFLQYAEAGRASRFPPAGEHRRRGTSWRVLTWEPWRIDWWATAVQFVGTLFFNISTFAAVRGSTMSIAHQNHRIWMPDVLGSICFLVASAMAWGEAGHRWWSWRPGSIGWRIAALNLVGSIAFGVSAVAAYVVPSDGELRNVALANLGTFVGAICFLVGGLLLLPERTAGPAVDDD
jgi:hypothetical protein